MLPRAAATILTLVALLAITSAASATMPSLSPTPPAALSAPRARQGQGSRGHPRAPGKTPASRSRPTPARGSQSRTSTWALAHTGTSLPEQLVIALMLVVTGLMLRVRRPA